MSDVAIAGALLAGMLVLMFLGVNIAITMFAAGFIGFGLVANWDGAFGLLKTLPTTTAFNYAFSVIPMFVLMGELAFRSGMSGSLYRTAEKWLSGIRGGLGIATIAACAGFSAISGSTAATAATMATVAYPEMKRAGYKDSLSTGLIAAGGTLGILIPPSTAFIFYSIIAEQSVGQMFAAGVVPGIILAFCYIVGVFGACRIRPDLAPRAGSYSWKERLLSLTGVIEMVVLAAVVIGGIFGGLFSANEAAAVGAFLAFLVLLINRKFSWKVLKDSLFAATKTTGMALFIVMGALLFGNFITVSGVSQMLNDFISGLDVNRYVVVFVIFVIYMLMGMVMDGLAIMFLTVPIFYPVFAELGFSPIFYGVFLVMVCELGLISPPVGLNVFVVAGVLKGVRMESIFRGVLPFVIAGAIAVAIVTAFPITAEWLPRLLYGS